MKNAEAPIPVDIERRLGDAGRRLGARHDVSFAYLFGGLASGRKTPLSDVDVRERRLLRRRYLDG